MYLPKQFAETDPETLRALLVRHPLATLITQQDGQPEANHIPMLFTPEGTLTGHVARQNPLWHKHPSEHTVLAIFQGPEAYITPSWYASKADTGRVVPTWNFVAVHAVGKIRFIEDPVWLQAHLTALTAQHEQNLPAPWQVQDAPADFLQKLMAAIVGFEIEITHLTGKWKVSQNRPAEDVPTLVAGLNVAGKPEMAELLVQAR